MLSADLVTNSPALSETPGTVAVLVITGDHAAYRRLESIFGHSKWKLQRVGRPEEVSPFLEECPTPVIITDDCSWRDVVASVACLGTTGPRVIVASRLADDPLWQEVLERGGYNVIRKPFEPAEVYWVVSNAWRDWRSARERTSRAFAAG